MTTSEFDPTKAEAFSDKLVAMLNHGGLALMTSVGHRTGLFDAMAAMPAGSSQQIAEQAGLNERYVREWLGAMVTGGIVDLEPESGMFRLPPEHAAILTRDASPDNLAAIFQYIPLLGSVEDEIVHVFKQGGGVPYSSYKRFHQIMAEDSGQTVVAALHDHILPLLPGIEARLKAGIDVLDVGCGAGRALIHLAESFSNSRFTGFDFSAEAIATGRAEAAGKGLTNVALHEQDAALFNAPASFDLVCAFDAIHDQAHPDRVLANIAAALRPDGVFLMQDIAASSHIHKNMKHPMGPLLYTISCMHCMTVSLSAGGMGLGAMWGREKAEEMLREAGFDRVRVEKLPHDPQNYYYIAHKRDTITE